MPDIGRIEAVLGPTNTGKTHYAIERMLAYRSGVIGLPLRLLAREVYDKIVKIRGPSVVALLTGEERIVPDRTQYWVCTVEAMPEGMGAEFVAIDEIQLCADPERGHVFTDRLLRARGLRETLFLGADTMRAAIAAQVPGVNFVRRDRMSQLTYVGAKKLSRMPARSAIVGFSVENVYAIAELLRRQKGGAAVVMGALSPRTRNAQVELYQNGDVDYLVATDAIGMGLNLDIKHVAFSSLSKFDGRRMRPLQPNELAQIAGRAGRHMENGTFGVTGEARPLSDEVAEAIMQNQFLPVRKLHWRNSRLEFGTPRRLIQSLEQQTNDDWLTRARDADDLMALKALADVPTIRDQVTTGPSVRLLWDVCRIPDFRGISHAEHASLLETIFGYLHELQRIPDDWMAAQLKRLDRNEGDIDTLSKRLSYIRTWTYVAQRKGWLDDESHWRGVTRAVEDRLSDALHERLTQRFVDRRTSVLLRRLKQKESLVAEVNDIGEVTVEGQFIGKLEGFRFIQDKAASADEAKTLRQASLQALAPHFNLRADRFYNAPDTEIDFTEQGGLMWGEHAVGKLVAGQEVLKPQVQGFVDEEAGVDVVQKVERRLQHFIDRKIASLFEPLIALQRDETLTGLARGFAFRVVEGNGILRREDVTSEVKSLDQDARGSLRKHGIRFGQFTIFLPLLLKPAPTRLRLVLWALKQDLSEFPESPPPGMVTIPVTKGLPDGYHTMSGYRAAGERAIRIDMLERLADLLRSKDTRGGFESTADMLSITGMTLEQFASLMQGLGYNATRDERPKVKTAPARPTEEPASAVEPSVEAVEATDTATPTPEAEPEKPSEAEIETETNIEATEPEAIAPGEVDIASAVAGDVTTNEVASAAAGDLAPENTDPAPASEVEVFYTFSWKPRARPHAGSTEQPGGAGQKERSRPAKPGKRTEGRSDGKPKGKRPPKSAEPKNFSSKPAKVERIDPDNPFAAALMGLRNKT